MSTTVSKPIRKGPGGVELNRSMTKERDVCSLRSKLGHKEEIGWYIKAQSMNERLVYNTNKQDRQREYQNPRTS